MDMQKIASALDHTQLSPTATWNDIRKACDEAVEFGTASVCIPASYVRDAAVYLEGRAPICTVIGFPHGNATTGAKLFEAKTAVLDGAQEIDMVVNLGHVKDGRFDKVFSEVSGIKAMIGEDYILKVIIETCLLTEEEKIHLCVLIEQAGADYVKTSTGFSTCGATEADIRLLTAHAASNPAGSHFKIKASGGIGSLEDAQRYLDLGAVRLGSSKVVDLLRAQGYRKP